MSVRCQKSGRLKKERKKSENVDDRPTQPQAIEKKHHRMLKRRRKANQKCKHCHCDVTLFLHDIVREKWSGLRKSWKTTITEGNYVWCQHYICIGWVRSCRSMWLVFNSLVKKNFVMRYQVFVFVRVFHSFCVFFCVFVVACVYFCACVS